MYLTRDFILNLIFHKNLARRTLVKTMYLKMKLFIVKLFKLFFLVWVIKL